MIDDLINEMNDQKKWEKYWPADPIKHSKMDIKHEVMLDGKIMNKAVIKPPCNVASRYTMKVLKATSGMKSGRASATGVKDAGKASRSSTKRLSAKSSVTRSQLEYKKLQ